ncbi:hypothetical protein M3Y98_01050100 [Aphelenchoides besseyi]|nr:hypothetical protein M3Y98_01050100 [Aphelenchoides besseyi]
MSPTSQRSLKCYSITPTPQRKIIGNAQFPSIDGTVEKRDLSFENPLISVVFKMSALEGRKWLEENVNQLIIAVTKDLLHEDNVINDLKSVLSGFQGTKQKQEKISEISNEIVKNFKAKAHEEIMTSEKTTKVLEKREELEKDNKSSRAAWRINGDPVHDTFAQRHSVYVEHLENLKEARKKLEVEVEKKKSEYESRAAKRKL